jgi:hypothetical protein
MLPPKYLYQVTTERHANVCAVLFLIYISFHRRPPAIWIATNDNLQDWGGFTRVIARPRDFILQPVETWERKGDVANVVFSGANPVIQGTVYVYYGAGDRVIGLESCAVDELLQFSRFG